MQRFGNQFDRQSLPEPGCRVEIDPEHIRTLLDRIGERGIAGYSVTRFRWAGEGDGPPSIHEKLEPDFPTATAAAQEPA